MYFRYNIVATNYERSVNAKHVVVTTTPAIALVEGMRYRAGLSVLLLLNQNEVNSSCPYWNVVCKR
jgi:hypothetical protein